MPEVIVIGGGPAGMMAAGTAAKNGCRVTLVEKNEKLGKKLYITGKGRCNVTNASDCENIIQNTVSNPYFLYSSLYTFTSEDTVSFFENMGIPLKTERGNRVFPASDKSSDIIKGLTRFLQKNKVRILLNCKVTEIVIKNGRVVAVQTEKGTLKADKVIIACGGLSYPVTGSDGDGYRFAKAAGHSVTKLYPALVPLKVKEKWVASVMGLSLKNVAVTCKGEGKMLYEGFGEMLFTHFGVSGPLILTLSSIITDKLGKSAEIYIDLKPALERKKLDERLLRDFEKYKNKEIRNALGELLPRALIPVIVSLSDIDETKRVNEITREERNRILNNIKQLRLTVTDTAGYNEAVVTKGGVGVEDIDPSTMESKKVKGLYFAGEVIDVDAFTGGYNIQIALSTGHCAGIAAAE